MCFFCDASPFFLIAPSMLFSMLSITLSIRLGFLTSGVGFGFVVDGSVCATRSGALYACATLSMSVSWSIVAVLARRGDRERLERCASESAICV